MDQLAEATRERGRIGKKLGAIMLDKGMMDELELAKVLALQNRHRKNVQKRRAREQDKPQEQPATPGIWVASDPSPLVQQPRRRRRQQRTSDIVKGALARATEEAALDLRTALDHKPDVATSPATLGLTDELDAAARPPTQAESADALPEPLIDRHAPTQPSMPVTTVRITHTDDGLPPAEPTLDDVDGLEPRPWTSNTPSAAMTFLHDLLAHASSSSASDVHLQPGMAPTMRQFSRFVPITSDRLTADATEALLRSVLTPWQQQHLDNHGHIDLAYEVPDGGRYRTNVYRQHRGLSGVFRVVGPTPPTLAELDLPPALAKLTNFARGLVLLVGPSGCGKTSTLSALVEIINEERSHHILTIEDPIEYVHSSRRCIVNQRQVGRHTASLTHGLRAAVRENPDIICISELGDREALALALAAADSGHLVMATMYAANAVDAIDRIIEIFPKRQRPHIRSTLSRSLRAVTSQRLLPAVDGLGSVAALEILYVDHPVSSLIRSGQTKEIHTVMRASSSQDMVLLDDSIRRLLDAGRITQETASSSLSESP